LELFQKAAAGEIEALFDLQIDAVADDLGNLGFEVFGKGGVQDLLFEVFVQGWFFGKETHLAFLEGFLDGVGDDVLLGDLVHDGVMQVFGDFLLVDARFGWGLGKKV